MTNSAGSVIQDLNIDCSTDAAGGTSTIANCLPFWDQYGQERSQLKRIKISNFSSFGLGIYTSQSQNGGPFEDLQMSFGKSATSSTACIEVGGNGVGGNTGLGPNPMRGIRGLTCVGYPQSPSLLGTGVDINERNVSLEDAHFEDMTYGVSIGQLAPASGVHLNNVTGGGASGVQTQNLVNIWSTCAVTSSSCSFTTANIQLSNLYQPTGAGGPALTDQITSNTTSEVTLGFYELGDGTGSHALGNNTRPVLTTSSSFPSSPTLMLTGMTFGSSVTGVQGSGTLVQMSTGTTTSGDIVKFDASGDTVDSGVSATNPAFGSINQSPSSSFGGTCALSGTGTTCTVTLSHTYTAPICIATEQGSSGSVKAAMCSVSGTTATVTASSSGSGVVWGVFVFGNPN
jgi:hypothetical protein